MRDLRGLIDVFIVTNGRETFPYALKCLQEQKDVLFDLTVIENKKWINACNKCLNSSPSPFYVRVDDDMFLHNSAIDFFSYLMNKDDNSNNVIVNCKLWEPGRKRVISGIKMYNRNLTHKVGFKLDKRGKVDKLFRKKATKLGFSYGGDKNSVVGIHAACSLEENMKYVKLRGEENDKTFAAKMKDLKALDTASKVVSLENQVDLLYTEVAKKNVKLKSRFNDFLKGKE